MYQGIINNQNEKIEKAISAPSPVYFRVVKENKTG
jgi:hypothetical protein